MSPLIQTMFQKAIQDYQLGNLKEAEEILRHCAQLDKKNFDVIHLLAVVYASQEKHQTAIEHYKKALELSPNNASALSNLGSSLNSIGHNQEAFSAFQKAIKIDPNESIAWYNAANTLCDTGEYEGSLSYYERSIKLNPQYYPALINYGKALFELKRYSESLTFYDKALSINQDSLDCLINKGAALKELTRYDEAIAHYDKALSLKPDYAEVWCNKGVALNGLKCYDEAIAHFDKALSLKPDYVEVYCNKGIAIYELKRIDEAITNFDKALSLKPDYAEAWSNKGATLNGLKRYDEAVVHYEKALSLKPDIDWASGDLLHTKMQICSWLGLAESLEDISNKVVANKKVNPFPLLSLSDDALLHKKSSEIYVQNKYPFNPILGPNLKYPVSQKIRVGYFSADFKNHPVSFLTAELFELHDKNRFEIIAFSFGVDDKSTMRLRLSQAFSQFIDVSDMSDSEIAELSRNLHIDIAIDLGGHTSDSRTGIFSYRAAPIQTSYIGYLGTIGAEYFDYLLADNTIVPEGLRKFYSEKIVCLPSYQVNDRKRTISERQFTREELGLPENCFVFCCFNNNYKIQPEIFNGWMHILNAVEGSVLFLYAENERSKANLINEASSRGVDSARLVFGGHIPMEEYLARYRACDLFLDTFPYNAGTTASDALWVGLPVLTLIGQSFASRVAASLLNAIGLPELITSTQDEYVALAIELALNPKKLAAIKLKLANNRLSTPLFDTPLFTKHLELAYIQMKHKYQENLQPDHIYITDSDEYKMHSISDKQ